MGDNGKENGNYYNGVILGGSQNYGPFLGTLNIRCRIIIGTQKGTIILTTTHITIHGIASRPVGESRVERRFGQGPVDPAQVYPRTYLTRPRCWHPDLSRNLEPSYYYYYYYCYYYYCYYYYYY